MPLYEYVCEKDHIFEQWQEFGESRNTTHCECGATCQRYHRQAPNFVVKGFDAYESPSTGNIISTTKGRDEDLKKSGCVEYDPGVKQDYTARVAADEAKLDKEVDYTVDKLFDEMPSDVRTKVENEAKVSELAYTRS